MSNRRILKKKLARAQAEAEAESRTETARDAPSAPAAPASILSERRPLSLPSTRFHLEDLIKGRTFGLQSVFSQHGNDTIRQHAAKIDVEMHYQERSNWCWAAVSSFCARALNRPRGQVPLCLIVNRVLQRFDCCTNTGEEVNKQAELSSGLRAVECSFNLAQGALSFDEILGHLKDEHPVIARFEFSKGGGHVFAIYGCTKGPEQLLHIRDSWYGESNGVPHESLKRRYRNLDGSWTHTYLVT